MYIILMLLVSDRNRYISSGHTIDGITASIGIPWMDHYFVSYQCRIANENDSSARNAGPPKISAIPSIRLVNFYEMTGI